MNRSGTKLGRKTKKAAGSSNAAKGGRTLKPPVLEADISPWTEALFAAEILILHATPIYYGFGVPRGDGSAVIIIPGFLGTDLYLMELHAWLGRIGYRPYFPASVSTPSAESLGSAPTEQDSRKSAARDRAEDSFDRPQPRGGDCAFHSGPAAERRTSVITLASPIAAPRPIGPFSTRPMRFANASPGAWQRRAARLLHRALHLQFC